MRLLESLDNIHASEDLIQDTLSYCKQSENPQRRKVVPMKKRLAVLVAVASLVVLSVVSVGAYYVKNNGMYKVTNSAQSLNHLKGVTDKSGKSYQNDNSIAINQEVDNKNLTVKLLSYVTDTHKVIFSAEVRTTDGSAINEMSENRVAVIARDTFKNIAVTVDGKAVGLPGLRYGNGDTPTGATCDAQRVDNGSDPTCAKFEITYTDYRCELYNANIGVTLSQYISDYTSFKTIDFAYKNVAEMFSNVKLASEDAFTVRPRNTADSRVELKPGNMHIAFSNKYKDAYIDNAGFVANPEIDSHNKIFVLTIVPGNKQDISELEKLTYQNQLNGFDVNQDIRLLKDDRVQLTYDVNLDPYFSQIGKGTNNHTTMEQLSNLVIKSLLPAKANPVESNYDTYTTVSDGTWNYQVQIASDEKNRPIELTPNVLIKDSYYKGMEMTATELKISTTELIINGTSTSKAIAASDKHIMAVCGDYSPIITMKNGTRFHVGDKCSGSSSNKSYIQEYSWELPTTIDVDDVQSISWHGAVLYTAK